MCHFSQMTCFSKDMISTFTCDSLIYSRQMLALNKSVLSFRGRFLLQVINAKQSCLVDIAVILYAVHYRYYHRIQS